MSRFRQPLIQAAMALLASVAFLSCDEDIVREVAPVEVFANVTDLLTTIDLADAECPSPAVTYELRARVKNPGITDVRFLDVIIRTRRTSYVRTDGGTVVPRPFIENLDIFLPATGAATQIPTTLIFAPGALNEAPFVALRTEAGGRDPETGLRFVRLEVIEEFFGETLAGDRVATSVRYPLTICINCGGCQPKGQ